VGFVVPFPAPERLVCFLKKQRFQGETLHMTVAKGHVCSLSMPFLRRSGLVRITANPIAASRQIHAADNSVCSNPAGTISDRQHVAWDQHFGLFGGTYAVTDTGRIFIDSSQTKVRAICGLVMAPAVVAVTRDNQPASESGLFTGAPPHLLQVNEVAVLFRSLFNIVVDVVPPYSGVPFRGLPSQDPQANYLIEMSVARGERKLILFRDGRDPNVILRNGCALPSPTLRESGRSDRRWPNRVTKRPPPSESWKSLPESWSGLRTGKRHNKVRRARFGEERARRTPGRVVQ